MLKFPRKEAGRREQKEGERKKEIRGQNGVVYWERRRKCVKRNEGAWLATRKKNIF